MQLIVCRDRTAVDVSATRLFRDRVRAKPNLAMAAPAGRSPRRMYWLLEALQREVPVSYARMHVFQVDELCPPAPADGYFWRQAQREFLCWAEVPPERCHPFRVDTPDLEAMCREYESMILEHGGIDLVMLGFGLNAHIAGNEPGSPFDSRTRSVRLWPETMSYLLTDDVIQGSVSDCAVTLGIATIMEAREVVMLVGGAAKREALRRVLEGPVTPEVPGSILRQHPRCTILADRDAVPEGPPPEPTAPERDRRRSNISQA